MREKVTHRGSFFAEQSESDIVQGSVPLLNDQIDRDDWLSVRQALRPKWPEEDAIAHPEAYISTEEYIRTAQLNPDILLYNVRNFVFLDELLNSMDV